MERSERFARIAVNNIVIARNYILTRIEKYRKLYNTNNFFNKRALLPHKRVFKRAVRRALGYIQVGSLCSPKPSARTLEN